MCEELLEKLMEGYDEEYERFVALCGKEDLEILALPPEERKTEDCVRLLCINCVFRFRRVVIGITGDAEDRLDEVLDYLDKVKGDVAIIDEWMREFISKIPEPELKEPAKKLWKECKKEFKKTDFNVGQFLKRP